ncbi:hypothetical protein [Helicobacter fennelliae]|uniref:hypothetical protein n=1 Tax=Helicobacter fennelliae TaxID=215 RepID=UPI0011C01DE9|nr:hypothetical protein [Helicobacter fennelliae]
MHDRSIAIRDVVLHESMNSINLDSLITQIQALESDYTQARDHMKQEFESKPLGLDEQEKRFSLALMALMPKSYHHAQYHQ